MLIKVLLLLAIAAVVLVGLRSPSGARHVAVRRMAVVGFAVLAVLSVLFPDAWNRVAALVGVGRGTDLLLYGLIVIFLFYMLTTYRHFREMEQLITVLARRVAIDEAVRRGPTAVTSDGIPSTDPVRTIDPPADVSESA